VRLNNTILNASNIHEMKSNSEDYRLEVAKNRRLEDIAVNLGFEVSLFNLSEYLKGGALLSCMIMHLNRYSYSFTLL
jgi:N-dimethylarginine dimethylaminohydrolase